MHVIITDVRLARGRAIHFGGGALAAAVAVLCLLLVLAALGLYHWQPWFGGTVRGLSPTARSDALQREHYMRANIDAMARKLGEAQARIMQLESLAERVGTLAGVPVPDTSQPPGQGGAPLSGRPLGMQELDAALDTLAALTEQRMDWLTVAESRLVDAHIRRHMVPTQNPVPGHRISSGFGKRIDPFSGLWTTHKGLDFPAPEGTPVMAAAGGVVIVQEHHPAFGNVVEIDHGNQLVTRYAHTSRAVVKLGDLVRRGQKIAEVGSTGRSTGAHLHFEVLVQGVQHDPQKFLSAGKDIKDAHDIALLPGSGAKPKPKSKPTSRKSAKK